MTRSLSFKFTGNPKEHVSRSSGKPPRPKKLDTDNWIKAKTLSRSSHVKEAPPDNMRSEKSLPAPYPTSFNKLKLQAFQ